MASRVYRRSVQLTGGSTLIISLPKSWVNEVGLKPRDEVCLEVLPDKSLKVYPVPRLERESKTQVKLVVDRGEEEGIERMLIAYYAAGYDTVKVYQHPFISEKLRRVIRQAVSRLAGFEVIEERADYVVMQNMLDPRTLPVPKVIERMEILLRAVLSDMQRVSRKFDEEILRGVIERDNDIDRFYFLLSRQITLSIRYPELSRELGLKSPVLIVPIRAYGRVLEEMGDTMVYMARYHLAYRVRPSPSVVDLMTSVFRSCLKAYRGDTKAQKHVSKVYNEFFDEAKPSSDGYSAIIGRFLSLCLKAVEVGIEREALLKLVG